VTLRRLRILAVGQVLGLILLLEVARHAFSPFLLSWKGVALMDGTIFLGGIFIVGAMFNILERMQTRLELQNRELMALHTAALDIYGELDLETVLQKVVDQARGLVDSRYGALSVIDARQRIASFITSGIGVEERARIGGPPVGHGLLGVPLREGQRLRLADLGRDPRAVGFPPNHPPMKSLLAVPILCASPFRGNLYLAEKLGGAHDFSQADEETLVRFATKAAIAIDNAHLHRRLNQLALAEERLRIAHEMHDGLAQVLAAVNAKAQAVREHLRAGHGEEASRQLEQLAAAAREVYSDVRESITGLRSAAKPDWRLTTALEEYAVSWQDQSGIVCELRLDREVQLPSATEFQLLRIVQEALTNVRKHAAARRVLVRLQRLDGRVRLAVADDGIGFDPAGLGRSELPRFGLATMRERAESIGARVRIGAAAAGGTELVVEIPLDPAATRA
jgi:signal transduction histidine kinase